MNLFRIKQKLYAEPVEITPDAHRSICETLAAHEAQPKPLVDRMTPESMQTPPPQLENIDGVGVGYLEGVISRKISNLERSCGTVGCEDVTAMVEQGLADDSIEAMVFAFDSPGGGSMGCIEAARAIQAAAQVKPIIAYTDGLLCSAAYKMAAGASAIYASESAQVGSISTYIALLDESRAAEMQGVRVELFTGGRLKGAGYPGTSLTQEQRDYLQEMAQKHNDAFTGYVNEARGGVDPEHMQGQVFMAADAMAANLIDSITDLSTAISDAKLLATRRQSRR